MICDEHKFIFVHLNKTGGTSIEKLFDSQADVLTNGITGNHDKHWTAADIQRAFPEKYATYFKFSFVRNPWNMVVSRYHWSRFHQVENGQPFLPSESFEAFVDRLAVLLEDMSKYDPELDGPLWIYRRALASQVSRLTIDSRIAVDFIGRFERLHADWEHIVKGRLQLPESYMHLPHVFKSNHRHYTEYYNDRRRAIVGKWFQTDIEVFGYTFDEK